MSALQVAKHPIAAPGPASVYSPMASRHATLPGVAPGALAGMTMTGSLPPNLHPPYMTPTMGARDISSLDQSSGYPTRPGTAASDLDTLYMGSPQISGNLFRSFPKPQSSPKMKLRFSFLFCIPFTNLSNFLKICLFSYFRTSNFNVQFRYLKSVFPTVEEYLLLDVLANSDNNVQKTADK